MKQENAIEILASIISPIVGRFLAERVAVRLYEILSTLDKDGTEHLLLRVHESFQQPVPPKPEAT